VVGIDDDDLALCNGFTTHLTMASFTFARSANRCLSAGSILQG
jgi:hypothetical protein